MPPSPLACDRTRELRSETAWQSRQARVCVAAGLRPTHIHTGTRAGASGRARLRAGLAKDGPVVLVYFCARRRAEGRPVFEPASGLGAYPSSRVRPKDARSGDPARRGRCRRSAGGARTPRTLRSVRLPSRWAVGSRARRRARNRDIWTRGELRLTNKNITSFFCCWFFFFSLVANDGGLTVRKC